MPEHVNVHLPHELEESHNGGHAGVSRRERNLEIVAALLLAITTLCVAWSGYQAAKWGGLQARRYTQASTARAFANRAQTQASQARLQDLLNFNRWLEAEVDGDTSLTNLYERRFRDEFRPAFDAWRAQGGALDPNIEIPTPLRMPQYVLAGEVKAEKLEALGDRRFEEGKNATESADEYVFATVFFAIVLFFSGVSLRFEWWKLRLFMVAAASAFLLWGIVQLLSLPVH
ncbi:MAG: hypothetical protein ABW033_00920 [Acidimicrobiia bacterium]